MSTSPSCLAGATRHRTVVRYSCAGLVRFSDERPVQPAIGDAMKAIDAGCPQCGAVLPADGDCWSRVNDLLEIETRALAFVDREAALRAFLCHRHLSTATPIETDPAHPRATAGRYRRDAGANRPPVEDLRRDIARATNGSQRAARRAPAGDRSHVPHWPGQWTMTVADVIAAPDAACPTEVARWALVHRISRLIFRRRVPGRPRSRRQARRP